MSDFMDFEEILKLPEMADVAEEIADPRYSGRSHGSRATAAMRCNGPLCRMAERMRGRRRNEAKALREGKEYIPGSNRSYDREELLLAITAWHKMDLYKRKMEAAS